MKTHTIKSNGVVKKLLTSDFDKSHWPALTLTPGIFTDSNVSAIERCGIGFFRANTTVAVDWPANERKKIATLPASACPEMHTYHYPQDGRWYLEIMDNGDVYLTVRQSGGVGKGLSCSFIVPYVLKISGGGGLNPCLTFCLRLLSGRWWQHEPQSEKQRDRMNQPGRARFLEPTLFPGALLGSLDIISCNCKHQALDPWHRSEIFLKR